MLDTVRDRVAPLTKLDGAMSYQRFKVGDMVYKADKDGIIGPLKVCEKPSPPGTNSMYFLSDKSHAIASILFFSKVKSEAHLKAQQKA
jgi:hypothetical protein